ncbi:MAG: YgiQ family radical SAM protein [Brevinematales bacterium]|nr:YgiQ family radical SAM protein [Brevinematales bacterium]
MFLPATKEEMKKLGWENLDIILVSGDAYIDSYYNGVALIGNFLVSKGFKVGVISQPDINSPSDITRLGEPLLFWGISAGCVDSMVANYTALGKKRKSDDFTPGGENNKRPDRATIVYTNLIKRYFKKTVPIVIGGIEASLRRIAHYDFIDNGLRKPILFDAKADILVYGMGELTTLELAMKLKNGEDYKETKGICFIEKDKKSFFEKGFIELPSFEEVVNDKFKFIEMFKIFYENNDPINGRGLIQKTLDRYLIQNPPQRLLTTEEMDYIYSLPFEREVHPYDRKNGEVKAIHTIQFSITTHRGCYGGCNFCAISVHQGKNIIERSEGSIITEVKNLVHHKNFKGYISDLGGPTANMYGIDCDKRKISGSCKGKNCMSPETCRQLKISHKRQLNVLKQVRKVAGIKKVFISSGIRPDLVLEDKEYGEKYLKEILEFHTSGQLKIAPEHSEQKVLTLMGKMKREYIEKFKKMFDNLKKDGQFLTYYFIAAHPGCNENDMIKLRKFIKENLKLNPEQVQIFTPTPSTFSTLMYYTEIDPTSMIKIFVEKSHKGKEKQKNIIIQNKDNR